MAKKPNAMGRIEADPKPKKDWKKIGMVTLYIALPLALIALGVASTLKYQEFINNTKAEGVAEYRINDCDRYTNEEKTQTWLECDVK